MRMKFSILRCLAKIGSLHANICFESCQRLDFTTESEPEYAWARRAGEAAKVRGLELKRLCPSRSFLQGNADRVDFGFIDAAKESQCQVKILFSSPSSKSSAESRLNSSPPRQDFAPPIFGR